MTARPLLRGSPGGFVAGSHWLLAWEPGSQESRLHLLPSFHELEAHCGQAQRLLSRAPRRDHSHGQTLASKVNTTHLGTFTMSAAGLA